MNQRFKRDIYKLGNARELDFISMIGGMDEKEQSVLRAFHECKEDIDIQTGLYLNPKTFLLLEQDVRTKTRLAAFRCIDFTMQYYIDHGLF